MKEEGQIEAFREYLIDNERSENTIDSYTRTVRLYYRQYGEVTKKNMVSFKQEQISRWKPKTAANRCVAMNQYCKFVGKPDCTVKTVKIQKRLSTENTITFEQYEQLLQCLKDSADEKNYWMIKFLTKTGARASEFVRFEKKHLKEGSVTLWTKGKIRRILIPNKLIEESREYFSGQPECKWMFPNRYGKQMTTEAMRNRIAGFAKYGVPREVLHPHSFRHLYAIQFLKTNNNVALLADLMGHENINTTAIYLQLSRQEQQRQLDNAMDW